MTCSNHRPVWLLAATVLLTAAPGAGNELRMSDAAKTDGNYALESIYTGSTAPAYLVHGTSKREKTFFVRFQIRPDRGFKMAPDSRHVIFQASKKKGKQPAIQVFLQATASGKPEILARARIDGDWRQPKSLTLRAGRWSQIEIEWRSESASGAEDGFFFIRVARKSRTLEGLANVKSFVEEVRLGQVDGGGEGNEGSVYYDAYAARREPF